MIVRHAKARTGRFLRSFRQDTNANALVLAAFAFPMLIGGSGMAVDFSQYYLWKRELQFAADQAAIAGAWELAQRPLSTEYVARALTEFNANEQITKDFNSTPDVVMSNHAGLANNAVQVTVSATKTLPFTSFFTGHATTVEVQSKAAFTGSISFTSCLIAEAEEDIGVWLNGDAVFTAECGIMALSDATKTCTTDADGVKTCTGEDAITVNGDPEIRAGDLITAGTVDDDLNDTEGNTIHELVSKEKLKESLPFKGLEPPIDKVTEAGTYTCKNTGKGKGSDNGQQIGVATPGYFDGGLTIRCNTRFEKGIYLIRGGKLTITGNYDVVGDAVMFILTDGAEMHLGGTPSDNGNGPNIGTTKINLQGIDAGTLESYGITGEDQIAMTNMLVFEDPDSEGANPSDGGGGGHVFAGNSNTWISGSIYLPKSLLTMAGTAKVANVCLLIAAYRVKLTGTTDLTDFCPDGRPEHETKVIHGTVMLVE